MCFSSVLIVVESSVEVSTRNGEHRVIDHRAVTYISDPFNKLVLVESECVLVIITIVLLPTSSVVQHARE